MKWKTVLAGTTALVIAGGAIAYAKPGDGPGRRADGWRPSAQDIAAFADARIAALKAGLELTPDQQKNWPPVESAMRDLAKQRADRFAARKNAKDTAKADPMQRLSRRADAMQARGAALKKLADAAKPLYDSLNDAQKHRFMMLVRLGGPFGGHHGWHRGHGRHGMAGWHHHGPRGPRFGGHGMGPGGPGGGPIPD
jgi:zinc resistance-associated protein